MGEEDGEQQSERAAAVAAVAAAAGPPVKMTEARIEENYTPEEREFVSNFYAEYNAAEEPRPDDDPLAVYSNDYKMYAERVPGGGQGEGGGSR